VLTGSGFLQALTERDRRWPRILAMAVAAPAVAVVLMAMIAILLIQPRLRRSGVYVLQLGAALGALAFGIILAARFIFDRPMRTWITSAPRFRWSLLAWGAGLMAIGIAALMTADALFADGTFELPILDQGPIDLKLFYAAALVVGLLAAAAAEEVVFRGYLLQQTAALTRNMAVVIGLNAAVFALFHLELDPSALAARALAGAAFAWAALRLGGLEFAIGAHVANNLMIGLIQAPMLPEDLPLAGDLDDVVGEVLLALYMVCGVELTRRMPRLMRTTSSPA
jgi:membrane protease YdiL (CAAX protease family)